MLTWNSEKYISECLNSILAFKQIKPEIYVVDNGSQDNTLKILSQFDIADNVNLLKQKGNLGTTVSRNKAIREIAFTDYVCILDSDTVVNETAFTRMIEAATLDGSIGIIGPTMVDAYGNEQMSGRNLPSLKIKFLKAFPHSFAQRKGQKLEKPLTSLTADALQDVPYLISACWLIPKRVIDKVGLFDEKIFYAPEDVDYCVRTWKAGYRVVRCWDAQIIHHYQRISKKKILSRMNLEHLKGLIYYFGKYKYLFNSSKVLSNIERS